MKTVFYIDLSLKTPRGPEPYAGLRLDHFLLSPHLDLRLKKAGVDKHVRGWEKTSDHAPVWIEITNK